MLGNDFPIIFSLISFFLYALIHLFIQQILNIPDSELGDEDKKITGFMTF